MTDLIPVNSEEDILPAYRQGPIGDLLRWHNLKAPLRECPAPELLIGMCMDHRNLLRMPRNFAYILRAGGANFRRVEFKVSFAIAIGGVRTMVLIGHSRCGMVHLRERREAFAEGLVERAGWTADAAFKHFDENAPLFEIDDAADFVADEARRLRSRYPEELPAFSAMGYREAFDVLAGRIDVPTAKACDAQRTWAYARRQRTWFRSEPGISWLSAGEGSAAQARRVLSPFLGDIGRDQYAGPA